MVAKIFKVFYKEFSGLHQAAFLLGIFALLSQILALVRDRLFAHAFGASTTLDLYYAAFRVPDILFAAIGSLVSVTVLIPFLVRHIEKDSQEARSFLSEVFTAFTILIVCISIILFFFIPLLSSWLYPAFTGSDHDTLVLLTRILLLSPILLGISNLLQSVTQTFRRFFVYAMAPILYNVGIIIGIIAFYPLWGAQGLVWGVVLGAVMHMSIQIPVVIRHGLLPKIALKLHMQQIWEVAKLSLPRTIGLSANNIALLVLVALASSMVEGSISIFNYAFNLQSVPLSIIGVSYSVAAFPTLARLYSSKEMPKFLQNIATAARHLIFWSVPILVLFIVLRAQIVRTILGSGQFSWTDTRLVAGALALFTVSLVAQGIVLLLVRGYYAAGNTRKPLYVNVISSVAIVVCAYFLSVWYEGSVAFQHALETLLRVEAVPGTEVLVLPLAYSIGMILNASILFWLFKRDIGVLPGTLWRSFWNSLVAALVMGGVAYLYLNVFSVLFSAQLTTSLVVFIQGFCAGVIGVVVGVIALYLLGSRELGEVWGSLHTRFWKTKPIAPESEGLR